MDLECLARELVLYSKSNEELVCRGTRQMGCRVQGLEAGRSVRRLLQKCTFKGLAVSTFGYQRIILWGLSSCPNLSCRCSCEDIRPMLLSKTGPGQVKEEPMGIRVKHHLIQGFTLFLLRGGITQVLKEIGNSWGRCGLSPFLGFPLCQP